MNAMAGEPALADMEFRLLGPLQVRRHDQVVAVRQGKQRALLAALLLRGNQIVAIEELVETLWGSAPPPSARVSVQNYVKRLRGTLGADGRDRISTQSSGYMISLDTAELDVTRCEALLGTARAAAATGTWAIAARQALAALSQWRGEPLADIDSEVLVLREVPRLTEMRLQAAETGIDAALHLGRHAEVVGKLRQLVVEAPLRERFHALLMLALYRDGRRAEALAAYQHARKVLIEDVGLEPGHELRRLQQRILAGDRELGAVSLATHAPVARELALLVPRQLPPPVAHFAGRAAELEGLTSLLNDPVATGGGTKIAVIGGTAGVGKTALAVHWAHQVAGSFPDGQVFLDLSGFGPAGPPMTQATAVSQVLEALQVPASRIPASLDGRVGLCRTLLSQRRILIVFDNAKDADQVRPLLPGGAGCLVLITSRAPLTGLVALEGARAVTLSNLTESEARQMVAQRLGPPRRPPPYLLSGAGGGRPWALASAPAIVATRPGQSLAAVAARLARAGDRLDARAWQEALALLDDLNHPDGDELRAKIAGKVHITE